MSSRVDYAFAAERRTTSQNTNLHYSPCCAELPRLTLMNNAG